MAPILKEAASAIATTTATPASPAAKSPNDAPARPQPVPLEIPVTVNGARTVEGSDKREPFAETTQTVLVFPHGAVIRIASPLAPGQLVFLTNEKTKKEVVCQVVKSKSGGSASGYVELQFTEPAPGFWGLRLPGTAAPPPSSAPAVPRPVATGPAPKPVAPAPPPAAKIPASQSVAPSVAQIPAPPTVIRIIPPASNSAPPTPQSVAPATPVSLTAALKLAEPAPVNATTPSVVSTPSAPLTSVPPPSPFNSEPASSPVLKGAKPLIPPPTSGVHDYSKEIESLFAVPQAPKAAKPAASDSPRPPVVSTPSTEQLKQQTARLQEQLSSMLFTEAPAAEIMPSATAPELKPDTPVTEVANKILEIAHEEANSIEIATAKIEVATELRPEIKPAVPARTPAFSSLSAKDEEVEIPAWLRPLSQNSETATEPPAPAERPSTLSSVPESTTLEESAGADAFTRSEAAVFGGQLLSGDSSAEPEATSGSKKGLFIGLAAAVVLLAAGGAWYYRQNLAPSTPAAQVSTSPATVSQPETSTTPAAATPAPPQPAVNPPASSAPTNSAPTRTPAPATTAPAPAPVESRRNAESRNSAPAEEPAKKPSLGEVHLAAPVVRGSGRSNPSGEPLPSIDAPTTTSGADALAAVAHQKAPAVPLPVGGDVKPAQLIKSVPPVYPPMAKTQRITGNVTLDALIDTNGNVAQVKVLSGPPLLHQSALEAVKQWKYSPAQLNGSPTAMHLTVTVQFRTQ